MTEPDRQIALATLGWDDRWAAAFASCSRGAGFCGRVAVEDKHSYVVLTERGELTTTVAGRLLHTSRSAAELPKVGDWVVLLGDPEQGTFIREVLPRRTTLTRKAAGREREVQVLATNVDTAFIVQAVDGSFNPRRLERFLVMVNESGAHPVVVLNKIDLLDDVGSRLAETQTAAGRASVFPVCARTGRGVDALREHLRPGETVVFIGASGVGKSSLINCLYGREIQATLEVREWDSKGRHATTWREMIRMPDGGLVIDTPGMREFHMWLADEGIQEAFPDVIALARQCQFRDCAHAGEKKCAVRAAVDRGELAPGRYKSYLKLKHQLDFMASENKRHTYIARKRRAAQYASRQTVRIRKKHPADWGDEDEG